MPKETFPDVRGAWTYATEWADQPDADGNPVPLNETTNDLALEVGWSESVVHLGSVNRAVDDMGSARGWVIELDRAGLNRLIKVLRRARDQAFGEDA